MAFDDSTIHLGIAFDINYLPHFYALFASIINSNGHNKIHVHSIITGVNIEVQKKIQQYATGNGHSISFYEIDEHFVNKFVLTGTWSSAVYYRLFFPLLVPKEVTRILYLDTDIVVVGDLRELYQTDLGDYPLAAVYDNYVKTAPQLGIYEEENYFNSGMMLMNIPVWNEQNISQQVFAYLSEHPERIRFVDQCGLNAVLINNWKKLNWRYNVMRTRVPDYMSQKEKEDFLKDKVIIHYTLDRPWKMLCQNPYRNLYHKFLNSSPYKPVHKYVDFGIKKLPAFFKIRLVEVYFNLPLLQRIWKGIKTKLA